MNPMSSPNPGLINSEKTENTIPKRANASDAIQDQVLPFHEPYANPKLIAATATNTTPVSIERTARTRPGNISGI